MRPDPSVHDALARLLLYPDAMLKADLDALLAAVRTGSPEAGEALEPFAHFAHEKSLEQLEELYAASFDCSEERALEVGWHAFGENYGRGAYLVRLRELAREFGVDEGNELPDHLANVLAVLGRCDEAEAGELAHDTVGRAVRKLCTTLKKIDNPWYPVLEAARRVLEQHRLPVAEESEHA